GRLWSVVFRGDYVNSDVFARVRATYDQGFALPVGHSSLWLRGAAGFSPQRAEEPFANFFFGGFGHNYLDYQKQRRFRGDSSVSGAEIKEIGGRNFVKGLAEWDLPLIRFSRVGTPGLYLSWIRPMVFVGALSANLDAGRARRDATTFGTQW